MNIESLGYFVGGCAVLIELDELRDNIRIYALGVGPYNPHPATKPTPASTAFLVWANSHDLDDNNVVTGNPGVYVPQK